MLAAVPLLAARLRDVWHLLEAVGAAVGRLRGPTPVALETLRCCERAVQSCPALMSNAPKKGLAAARAAVERSKGRGFPQTLLQVGCSQCWSPFVKKKRPSLCCPPRPDVGPPLSDT